MNSIHPTTSPIRHGALLRDFEAFDRRLLEWARTWDAEEAQFPALIAETTLRQAEYPSAFPHLLMTACRCDNPARPLERLLAAENLVPSQWLLSPAVCYHAYAWWAGQTLASPRILTARGRCFRHEAEFVPGRRQLEFEMREIIACGSPGWLDALAREARDHIEAIANEVGVAGEWETASDPFFLPASGKALLQRLRETKKEFVARDPQPLALASINRHDAFFGERFGIRLADGSPAHTACIAFGLDRWAHVITASTLTATRDPFEPEISHCQAAP